MELPNLCICVSLEGDTGGLHTETHCSGLGYKVSLRNFLMISALLQHKRPVAIVEIVTEAAEVFGMSPEV